MKTAAIVTINKPARMTKKGRKQIAVWLRRQAYMLEKHANNYSNTRFRARYLYK